MDCQITGFWNHLGLPCADPTALPPSPALHFPLHGRSPKATNLDSLSSSFKTIVTLQLLEILVLQFAFTMFWQTKRWSAFLESRVARIVLFAVKSATTLVLINSGSVMSMCPVMHLDAFCRSPQHQRAVVSSQTIYWSLRCISSPALECDTAVRWLSKTICSDCSGVMKHQNEPPLVNGLWCLLLSNLVFLCKSVAVNLAVLVPGKANAPAATPFWSQQWQVQPMFVAAPEPWRPRGWDLRDGDGHFLTHWEMVLLPEKVDAKLVHFTQKGLDRHPLTNIQNSTQALRH